MTRLVSQLFKPVDIALLVYFRLAFGGIMLWEMLRFFAYGRVKSYWIDPQFHFKYFGFEWVHPLPPVGMYWVCCVMTAATLGILLGYFYRVSAALFALGITYLFLIDQSQYINHFYLMCLLGFIAVLLPAHRAFSVDAALRKSIRSDTAPAWTVWLLRAQMGIVYFYGGIAKINLDWLRGEPMRTWLRKRADYALVGKFFETEVAPYFFSYGGLLFDLCIVPLLLWRRTRIAAFILALCFHATNEVMFTIGVFPYLSVALTALFFSPDWPRRFGARVRSFWYGEQEHRKSAKKLDSGPVLPPSPLARRLTLGLLAVYFGWQLLLPLRHSLYPGNVHWTEEGHMFSWHMMLRTKTVHGFVFSVDDKSQETSAREINPSDYLTRRQIKKMRGRPEMLQQFCRYLGELEKEKGATNVEVRARIHLSLNGREPQLLLDPNVDLAAAERKLGHATWIQPLETPFRWR